MPIREVLILYQLMSFASVHQSMGHYPLGWHPNSAIADSETILSPQAADPAPLPASSVARPPAPTHAAVACPPASSCRTAAARHQFSTRSARASSTHLPQAIGAPPGRFSPSARLDQALRLSCPSGRITRFHWSEKRPAAMSLRGRENSPVVPRSPTAPHLQPKTS